MSEAEERPDFPPIKDQHVKYHGETIGRVVSVDGPMVTIEIEDWGAIDRVIARMEENKQN